MLRRLQQDVRQELNERTRLGQKLRSLINLQNVLPAGKSIYHDYWVFPAIVENPQDTISALRSAGFDACDLPRSEAIKPPSGRDNLRAVVAEAALEKLIVLPCYPEMPEKALEVEALAFNRVAKVAHLPEPLTKSSAA
jgi:dTDP-4-amino-4,6-dideoxygalactose transaminase